MFGEVAGAGDSKLSETMRERAERRQVVMWSSHANPIVIKHSSDGHHVAIRRSSALLSQLARLTKLYQSMSISLQRRRTYPKGTVVYQQATPVVPRRDRSAQCVVRTPSCNEPYASGAGVASRPFLYRLIGRARDVGYTARRRVGEGAATRAGPPLRVRDAAGMRPGCGRA